MRLEALAIKQPAVQSCYVRSRLPSPTSRGYALSPCASAIEPTTADSTTSPNPATTMHAATTTLSNTPSVNGAGRAGARRSNRSASWRGSAASGGLEVLNPASNGCRGVDRRDRKSAAMVRWTCSMVLCRRLCRKCCLLSRGVSTRHCPGNALPGSADCGTSSGRPRR